MLCEICLGVEALKFGRTSRMRSLTIFGGMLCDFIITTKHGKCLLCFATICLRISVQVNTWIVYKISFLQFALSILNGGPH